MASLTAETKVEEERHRSLPAHRPAMILQFLTASIMLTSDSVGIILVIMNPAA
jgi:hypothetical protein